MDNIIKGIIPAAGLATRYLPYAKAVPKEMLPLLNKPAMQLIVEEALAASLSTMLIVTRSGKQTISDYFDTCPAFDAMLHERRKEELMVGLRRITKSAHFSYIHQPEPLGLGHALWLARHTVGKEYCAILLPDDIIMDDQPAIGQLMRIARQEKASVIAVQEVAPDQVSNYGIISVKKQITPNLFQVGNLVEKPSEHDAPSNLAIVGRYVLSHKIFAALEELSVYATEELQLTDAIARMLQHNERVFAYKIQGTRFDIGTPLGWLKANIHLGLQSSIGPDLQEYCIERILGSSAALASKRDTQTIKAKNR